MNDQNDNPLRYAVPLARRRFQQGAAAGMGVKVLGSSSVAIAASSLAFFPAEFEAGTNSATI